MIYLFGLWNYTIVVCLWNYAKCVYIGWNDGKPAARANMGQRIGHTADPNQKQGGHWVGGRHKEIKSEQSTRPFKSACFPRRILSADMFFKSVLDTVETVKARKHFIFNPVKHTLSRPEFFWRAPSEFIFRHWMLILKQHWMLVLHADEWNFGATAAASLHPCSKPCVRIDLSRPNRAQLLSMVGCLLFFLVCLNKSLCCPHERADSTIAWAVCLVLNKSLCCDRQFSLGFPRQIQRRLFLLCTWQQDWSMTILTFPVHVSNFIASAPIFNKDETIVPNFCDNIYMLTRGQYYWQYSAPTFAQWAAKGQQHAHACVSILPTMMLTIVTVHVLSYFPWEIQILKLTHVLQYSPCQQLGVLLLFEASFVFWSFIRNTIFFGLNSKSKI